MKNIIISLLIVFGSASTALAYGSYRSSSFGSNDSGFVIMPQGIYYFYSQNTGTTTTVTRWSFDGSLGYHFTMFYVGGEYNYDQNSTSFSNSNPTSTDTYKAYGLQAGILTDNVTFLITYFIGSTATTQGGTTSEKDYNNGSGYEVTAGYLFDVTSQFFVGPEFQYRSLTYTGLTNGQPIGTNYIYTTLIPMIAFKYNF
jgi:hypothetical protein